MNVEIQWDPEKAEQNVFKHGVRFADAVLVLEDPYALTIVDDESSPGESRWVTMGADPMGRVLVIHLPRREYPADLGPARGTA